MQPMRVSLLLMGLSASALIALTALVRLIAGKRLPRRAFVALWDVAALRMLLPLSFPVRVFARTAPINSAPLPAPRVPRIPSALPAPAIEATALPSETAVNPLFSLLPAALRAIWIAGALGIACFLLVRYARCLRAFRLSLPDGDARTARFLAEHPLRRRVRVRVSDAIASPLSYGVLRPVILLPKAMDRRDERALRFVLLHELMHIRALDAVRKPLLLLALCLHWMNPFSYVLLILASRDMELLCDERVLARGGPDARRAYALTLLSMEERRSLPYPLASGFSRTAIEERIKAMKTIKPKGALSLAIAALLVFSSCAAFASGEATQSPSIATATDDSVVAGSALPSVTVATVDVYEGTDGFSLVLNKGDGAESRLVIAQQTALLTDESLKDGDFSVTFSSVADLGDVAEGSPFLSAESWENVYSAYAPYGLSYDAQRGRLTFDGKLVRHFEDMVPVGDGSAGTVCSFPDGEVDVFVQRDLDATIVRDADGSYDPFKVFPIVSLQPDSQEAFDARTRERESARAVDIMTAFEITSQVADESAQAGTQTVAEDRVQIAYDAASQIPGGTVITFVTEEKTAAAEDAQSAVEATEAASGVAGAKTFGVTWWTAEEYRAWLDQERVELQSLVGTGAKAYTPTKGWFEWTQEEVDEAIALYERILSEIENGALYGVTDDGGFLTMSNSQQNR